MSPDLTAAIQSLSTAVAKLTAVIDAMAGAAAVGGGAAASAPVKLAAEPGKAVTEPPKAPADPPKAAAPAPAPPPPPPAPPAPTPGAEKLILPVGDAPVTSGFGADEGVRGGVPHTGTDYGAPAGTPIKAAASGTVTFSGWEPGGGGNVIIIDHGDGKTLYAHQSELLAKVGQVVKQGDIIGKVGQTGAATGPHLHFEVIKGARGPGEVDPVTFMKNGGTV